MPYASTKTEFITSVPNLFVARNTPVNSENIYVDFTFNKASTTITYTRSFGKVDDYFSYIGGLIGSALVLFFMLKSYSERSLLLDIAAVILENEHS